MPSALVIEIGKRAKMKDGGGGAPDAEEESTESDAQAIMESAATDVAKALGIDEKSVDLEELTTALHQFVEACMGMSHNKEQGGE